MKKLLFKITGHFKFRHMINWSLLILIGLVMLNFSCSENDEPGTFQNVTQDAVVNENVTQDAVVIDGFPKTIKKFENDKFVYWAHYYFRQDGNILKVDYGHPSSSQETFSYHYYYDTEGKIVKMAGWDDFDFFYEKWPFSHLSPTLGSRLQSL